MRLKTYTRRAAVSILKAVGLDDLFLSGAEHPAFSSGRPGGANIDDAYTSSWIAYACIAKQAKDISGVPIKVLRDKGDNESVVKGNDRLARMLAKPFPGVTSNQMLQYIVTMLRLRGAFFIDFDNPDTPSRIIPWRDPRYWRAHVDQVSESVAYWKYDHNGKTIERLPSEVVVGRQIDPIDPWGWQSPLTAAADPLRIDKGGDRLNAQAIDQGGQPGLMFTHPGDMSPEKQSQLLAKLQMRSPGKGEPPRPIILTNGLGIVDPKFTQADLEILAQQERSAEKICAIYGMSPALLFKDDTPNRATFETRRRIYWSETLIPIMRNIESALDEWTQPRYGTFVRFDLSSVQALRDDLLDLVKVGKVLHTMQVPVAAINDRLGLGLNLDLIPGADQSLVASSLVPVSVVTEADYSPATATGVAGKTPEKSIKTEPAPAPWKPTNKTILMRHRDAVAVIARGKARTSLEVRCQKAYRAEVLKFKSKALKAAAEANCNVTILRSKLQKLVKPMGEAMAEAVAPYHRDAAVEGALSILDLISEDRMYGTKMADVFRRMPELPNEAVTAINARRDYLKTYKSGHIIEQIFDDIEKAALADDGWTGNEIAGIAKTVGHRFNVEVNQANLIGRQEVGTAFNASRFGTMRANDFEEHEWMTAGDELVRGESDDDLFSHVACDGEVRRIGRTFPNDLEYPQENGGEPGNTINCRCLTIPVAKE